MNQPSLPPQGRYNDPHIQGLVVEELRRNNIDAEKFYFTSDDWMVSYDGQVPAWNSVFGVAPYRKDGQSFYAECGVSQRFDAATGQWSEPAATIKEGLTLSDAEFDAAPGALSGAAGGAMAGGSSGNADSGATEQDSPSAESSSTILASSMPDLGVPPQPGASGPESAQSDAGQTDSGLAGFVAPAETTSQADAPDLSGSSNFGQSDDFAQSDDRPAISQTGPRHAVDADDDASADREASADDTTSTGVGEPASADVGVTGEQSSGSVDPWAPATGTAVTGAVVAGSAGARDAVDVRDEVDVRDTTGIGDEIGADGSAATGAAPPEAMAPGGGSAVYGGDAINSREPVYESDTHGGGDNQANVAGYSLSVKEDGTAELRVPLGGQVTLRWADQ